MTDEAQFRAGKQAWLNGDPFPATVTSDWAYGWIAADRESRETEINRRLHAACMLADRLLDELEDIETRIKCGSCRSKT